jgi:hypothetical protein
VLALVLGSILTSGQALAVVVASRVILVACDVTLAALVAVVRRPPGPALFGPRRVQADRPSGAA